MVKYGSCSGFCVRKKGGRDKLVIPNQTILSLGGIMGLLIVNTTGLSKRLSMLREGEREGSGESGGGDERGRCLAVANMGNRDGWTDVG